MLNQHRKPRSNRNRFALNNLRHPSRRSPIVLRTTSRFPIRHFWLQNLAWFVALRGLICGAVWCLRDVCGVFVESVVFGAFCAIWERVFD